MRIAESLVILKKQCINFVLPDIKFNYYYEPTDHLSQFDEISVIYKSTNEEIFLGNEMIDIVVESLRDACLRLLDNEAMLPDSLSVGTVGYHYNITTRVEGFNELYLPIFVWSGKLKPTFLYEKDGKMYLEIFPLYPGMCDDSEGDNFSLEECMKSILIEIPDRSIIQNWLLQCESLLKVIESNHTQRLRQLGKIK